MTSMYRFLVAVFLLSAVTCGQNQQTAPGPVAGQAAKTNPAGHYDALLRTIYAKNNSFLCEICEEVVGFLKNVTTNKEILNGIEEIGKDLCQLVPNFIYKDCIDFMELLPEIIKSLGDEYLDPHTDCAYLCAGKPPPIVLPDTKNKMLNNIVGKLKTKIKSFN